MAKGIYIGENNLAKKVKKIYIGVNGVARKVKKAYIGVNGIAKQFYSSDYAWNIGAKQSFNLSEGRVGLCIPLNNGNMMCINDASSVLIMNAQGQIIKTTSLHLDYYIGYPYAIKKSNGNVVIMYPSYKPDFQTYKQWKYVVVSQNGDVVKPATDFSTDIYARTGKSCVFTLPNNNIVVFYSGSSNYFEYAVFNENMETIKAPTRLCNEKAGYFSACYLDNGNIFIHYLYGDYEYDRGYDKFLIIDTNFNIIKQPTETTSPHESRGYVISVNLLSNGNVVLTRSNDSRNDHSVYWIYSPSGALVKGFTKFAEFSDKDMFPCTLANKQLALVVDNKLKIFENNMDLVKEFTFPMIPTTALYQFDNTNVLAIGEFKQYTAGYVLITN